MDPGNCDKVLIRQSAVVEYMVRNLMNTGDLSIVLAGEWVHAFPIDNGSDVVQVRY